MVYESSVVKSINKNENSMKLENGVTVEPDSDTVATFIYKDGALVTDVTQIAAKSMATVYTSKNGKVRKVIITEETVSGVVTKKGKDYVEINGQILKPASQAVMDQMTVGDNVKVNLSADGLITKVELLGKSGFKYGFLVYIGADSGFGSTGGGMKLFTEDGKMETLRFSEGFSLNGSKTNSKGNAITVADVIAKLRENGSVNQLIRYYLAEDGTVKRIDVYYNNTAENGGTGYDVANFSLDYNKESMLYGTFVAGKHTLRSDTIAFVVPDSNIENAKSDQFAVGNWASIIGTGAGYGQDEKYMMTMFDADEGFGASVVVVAKNANPKLTNYQRLAVVADVEYGVDYEGEEATVLSMMINNEKTLWL